MGFLTIFKLQNKEKKSSGIKAKGIKQIMLLNKYST